MIGRPDLGEASDLAHGVGVDDEVLAEIAARGQAVFAEQRPDVAARVHAYQLMRTGTGASARSLIDVNTSVCITMSTPAGNGVLTLFTHVVVWPLLVLVTVSVEPHGAKAVVHGRLVGSA